LGGVGSERWGAPFFIRRQEGVFLSFGRGFDDNWRETKAAKKTTDFGSFFEKGGRQSGEVDG
jgi:hypothetical protein